MCLLLHIYTDFLTFIFKYIFIDFKEEGERRNRNINDERET